MPKPSFNQFLNADVGPSTPQRGRGRGRGSGGGFRGGGAGFGCSGTPTGKRSFTADYTNMPFDYDKLNANRGYGRMDGFSVDPFGSAGTPNNDSPSFRGRGRGRGRGGFNGTPRPRDTNSQPNTPYTPLNDTPSGSRTPVTGLGYHGTPSAKGKNPIRTLLPIPGAGPRSTVGKGLGADDKRVTWGGRGAPLFVKAGELFRDGEVDVITHEEDKPIEVIPVRSETVQPSPPATTASIETQDAKAQPVKPTTFVHFDPFQVLNHGHEEGSSDEVEVIQFGATGGVISRTPRVKTAHTEEERSSPKPEPALPSVEVVSLPKDDSSAPPEGMCGTSHISGNEETNTPKVEVPAGAGAIETVEVVVDGTAEDDEEDFSDEAPVQLEDEPTSEIAESMDIEHAETAEQEEPLFFVDTEPAAEASTIIYDTSATAPVGLGESESDPEEIVFKPRKYKEPQAINVPTSKKTASAPADPFADGWVEAPRQPRKAKKSRAAKKAAKREKKKTRGTGKSAAAMRSTGDVIMSSDIEWGSDGPPKRTGLDVAESSENEEDDIDVLRDYLAGTRLAAESNDDEENEEDAELAHPGLGSAQSQKLFKGRKQKMRAKEWDDAPDEILDSVLDPYSDDDSSDLGDLQAVMAALDSDDDDDEEEDDEEETEQLFKGENAWTSEDEDAWFVRSMEEALSGVKGSLGGSSSRGMFGGMQIEEYDDLDLPTAPVKKGKKKLADVPEALQAQWEADRRKKAAKKQEREIERLLSTLQATAAAPLSGKRKAKGSVKAQQAALAHLIPASAAQVADMFDVSSDEAMFNFGSRASGRGRGAQSALANMSSGLAGILEQVRVFVDDPQKTTHTLPPMDKEGRRKMHMLAECFDLKSKSKGAGKARFTILIKTSRTGLHVDENALSRLVAASDYTGGHFYKAFYSRSGGKGKFAGSGSGGGGGGGAGKKGPSDRGGSTRAKEGDLVGHGADRIGQDNVGHRLLSMMGWAEGGRIGRTEGGLDQPIVAVVKNTKSGLGA